MRWRILSFVVMALGALMFLFAIFALYDGSIRLPSRSNTWIALRKESPEAYWVGLAIYLLSGGILIYFGFHSAGFEKRK
jgi:divalent metal cation (Fe/Co/Zn/Cd) transporter